jgi:serralysin
VTNLTGVGGLNGNDTLTGSSFADRLDGGSGNDTVQGGAGDDTIVVRTNEALNDIIDGGAGTADRILVEGNSNLSLSNTNLITGIERLEGGGGAIVGSSGADTLDFSGIMVSGISSIQGGSGADTIGGGTGADVLTGGSGNDAFVYRVGVAAGADRITDFDVGGNDVIRLVGFSASSNLAAATTFDSLGALIDLSDIGGSGTIHLTGVTSLSFTTEDFLFS